MFRQPLRRVRKKWLRGAFEIDPRTEARKWDGMLIMGQKVIAQLRERRRQIRLK